jgi:glycosyltransferase involved in cell wall biosynthesis
VIEQYKTKDDPLVSIIIPAYNASQHIAAAIESVLIQNYRNFEIVVVDDGSTDNTRQVVEGFKGENVKYVYQSNKGVSAARNTAIRNAKGKYIAPLDADDMIMPYFISNCLKAFETDPQLDSVYTDVFRIFVDEKRTDIWKNPDFPDRRELIRDLFKQGRQIVPFGKGLIKADVFEKIGLYDESLIVGEDYDMIRRFVKNDMIAYHVAEPLYIHKLTSNSLSKNINIEKVKCHYDILKRYRQTFTCEELFPGFKWSGVEQSDRQLYSDYLTASAYLDFCRYYLAADMQHYGGYVLDNVCELISNCYEIQPGNDAVWKLAQRCKSLSVRMTV